MLQALLPLLIPLVCPGQQRSTDASASLQATDQAQALKEMAARAGEQVNWAHTWQAAADHARQTQKPILVVLWRLSGFADIPGPKVTLFSDPQITECVNRWTVPLYLTAKTRSPLDGTDVYGLGPTAFGQALILCMPDGEVLLETHAASNPTVARAFLARGLRLAEDRMGQRDVGESQTETDPVARRRAAASALSRMDADGALELLEGLHDAEDELQRAQAQLLGFDAEQALLTLQLPRVTNAADDPDFDRRLLLDRGRISAHLGQTNAMEKSFSKLVKHYPKTPAAAQARLGLAFYCTPPGDPDALRKALIAVALDYPDDPCGWSAAALYDSSLLVPGRSPGFVGPNLDAIGEATALVPFRVPRGVRPTANDKARREAIASAAAFLRQNVTADSTWTTPRSLLQTPEGGPDVFVDAVTALAGSALLELASVADSADSTASENEKLARVAQNTTLLRLRLRERTPPKLLFMDYSPWGLSMQIEFLADCLERDGSRTPQRSKTKKMLKSAVRSLADIEVKGGGWSYYLTNDLGGPGQPPHAISFTTAAALHALAHAREVGIKLPKGLLKRSVDTLERMRTENEVFAYFLYHGVENPVRSSPLAGSVGRGPACERALAMAIREKDSAARFDRSLALFLDHADTYDAQRGKAVMHAGSEGQGCHYLFFDYFHAARAWRDSSRDPKTRIRLLELILGCQQEDGSFQDTPGLGRNYGTAMALMALTALADDPRSPK